MRISRRYVLIFKTSVFYIMKSKRALSQAAQDPKLSQSLGSYQTLHTILRACLLIPHVIVTDIMHHLPMIK
jgi:hypothetical protein